MSEGGQRESGDSFRVFWLTLLLLNLGLIAGGAVYATQNDVATSLAIPVVAAFLVQASLFWVPGFPQIRRWLEQRLSPAYLALSLALASLAPYLIYAIPCGVFTWGGFAFVAGLCFLIAFIYVVAPPRSASSSSLLPPSGPPAAAVLEWQDVVAAAALAYPWVSGLGSPFHNIYPSPGPAIPRLDYLGKLMLVALGTMAFLSLRRLPRTGYRFAISREDFLAGVRNFALFVPAGALVALSTGFLRWGPQPVGSWIDAAEFAGNALGIYLAVALPSEMYFRGVLQNLLAARLGRPQLALLITSALFGLSHLGRGFPNWEYAAVTAVLGWFCGRAYAQRQSVVAAAVTHTLAVLARRYLFE
ncbi:MAG: CPBP family intramembrane glutamic endopeptidase [Bryobacterales bacterium]